MGPHLRRSAHPAVGDGPLAVGPDEDPPPPFSGLPEFRFLCMDYDEVGRAARERATRLAREIDADGVLLDRIRWPSPSLDPARHVACFCEHCREAHGETASTSAITTHVTSISRSLEAAGRSSRRCSVEMMMSP